MKHNIFTSVSIFLLILVPFISFAQNADEIIAKHIEAHGGIDKWAKVNSMKLTGSFTAFSLDKIFSCYKTKDGRYYADFLMGEKPVIEAFDGHSGWSIDPWQDIDYARKLNPAEQNVFTQKAEFITPFFNYQSKGHVVEYLGIDTIDGMLMHKLKLTKKNTKIETWYLDVNTYLEYHYTSEWVDFMRGLPCETYFDDFRNIDGLNIPHNIIRTFWQRDRVWQIDKVEINPTINQKLFEMPRRPEIDKLYFLTGDWDVQIEVWTRAEKWYPWGQSTSLIKYTSTNLLIEEIDYVRSFPIHKVTNFSYNSAFDNYRITIFNDITSEIDIMQGEFQDSTFIFDNLNITYEIGTKESQQHTRYIIKDWEESGFVLQRLISRDKGETWLPRDQFTYTRKK